MDTFPTYVRETLKQMQTSDASIGVMYDAVHKIYKLNYTIAKLWNVTAQKLVRQLERLVTVRSLIQNNQDQWFDCISICVDTMYERCSFGTFA